MNNLSKITSLSLLLFYGLAKAQTEIKSTFLSKIAHPFSIQYILQKPKNTLEPKPLLIFLHGSGEKGTDLEKLKIYGPLKYIQKHPLEAYILAPLCPTNGYWNSEELYQLILKISSENNIDSSRIYLTGLSMGAWGSWNLVFAHPELFAALVPIAGFVDRIPMIENCKIKDIPTRIFHGLQDDVVAVKYSIDIYNKLKDCSKDIKLEIFEEAFHDSWTKVYDHQEIYDWMFQQKLKQ